MPAVSIYPAAASRCAAFPSWIAFRTVRVPSSARKTCEAPLNLLTNIQNESFILKNRRKTMKKKISKAAVLLLSLTLVISLFASCGGGGGDTEGKTSLVVAVDNDYATLHPCNWSTTVEQRMNSQIYDTVLRKYYEDQTKLEPRVAEKWEFSKDGKC